MKITQIMILAIALLFCPVIQAAGIAIHPDEVEPLSERKIKLHFQIAKDTFLTCEMIRVVTWVENIGSETEYFRYEEVQQFELKDNNGVILEPLRKKPRYMSIAKVFEDGKLGWMDWQAISPGGSALWYEENLFGYYGKGIGLFNFCLEPGTYYLTGENLQADTAIITIIEPSELDDIAVAKRIQNAVNSVETGRRLTPRERYRLYKDILKDYPNTAYTPRVLCGLLAMGYPGYHNDIGMEEAEIHSYALRIINEYSKTGFLGSAMFHLRPDLLSPAERISVSQFLQQLRAKCQNSTLGKAADELLKKIEN